jgi:ribonuclease HI
LNLLYTDGACSGNPGPGGWAFLLIVPELNLVIEKGGGKSQTTNNEMELKAAIEGLKEFAKLGAKDKLEIHADSKFVINGITQWVHGWKKRGWKKADGETPSHQGLWEELDALAHGFAKQLDWQYIPAHSGFFGNERVDQIGVDYTQGVEPDLYHGKLDTYPHREEVLKPRVQHASGGDYPAYLSYVAGELQRHKTWTDCEMRIKGQGRALYKKVKHALEEAETLKKWGLAK